MGLINCFVPQRWYTKDRLLCRGGGEDLPHTQGLALWLSWPVATLVASSISSVSMKCWPARASFLNSRHRTSCKFSQAAAFGMKTCSTRGWASNHCRIGGLLWLARLSVIK